MELPNLLDFYLTVKPIQPNYVLYHEKLIGALIRKGYCFGAAIKGLASRTVRKRYDHIVKLDDPNYRVVRVKNGNFTVSLVDCDEVTNYYPTDERGYNSARMLVSVSSPELLEKTGGRSVCLFMFASELMGIIVTSGGMADLTIPGEFYIRPLSTNHFIATTGFHRVGFSNRDKIGNSVRLSEYREGSTTSKLVPGKLYLYKNNTNAIIYLGKISKVVRNSYSCLSSVAGLYRVEESLSKLPRIKLEKDVDLFVGVDYDSCVPLLDSPTKPTLLEFISDLVEKSQTCDRFFCGRSDRKTKLRLVETDTVIDIPSDFSPSGFFGSIASDLYNKTGIDVFMALYPDLLKKENLDKFLDILEFEVKKSVNLNYTTIKKGETDAAKLLDCYYFNDRTTVFTHPELLGMSEDELIKRVTEMLEKIN